MLTASQPVVLVHNILAPYRVGLFNALHEAFNGEIVLALGRLTHPKRRKWTTSLDDVRPRTELLRTHALDWSKGAIDVSLGVPSLLEDLNPRAVIVTGYDMYANWRASSWAQRNDRPVVAWTESWEGSIRRQDRMVDGLRRRYLSRADALLVPGVNAARFAHQFAPTTPTVYAPNSVDVPELRALPASRRPGRAVFIGAAGTRKGFDLILDAIPELLEIYDGIDLVGDGPLLGEATTRYGRNERVVTHGHVGADARAAIVNKASTLLLPSRRDPWPLAAAEALVAGRSLVLGPGVGSAPDLTALAGDAVATMDEPTAAAVVRAAGQAVANPVPPDSRSWLTHAETAQAFVEAVHLACEH